MARAVGECGVFVEGWEAAGEGGVAGLLMGGPVGAYAGLSDVAQMRGIRSSAKEEASGRIFLSKWKDARPDAVSPELWGQSLMDTFRAVKAEEAAEAELAAEQRGEPVEVPAEGEGVRNEEGKIFVNERVIESKGDVQTVEFISGDPETGVGYVGITAERNLGEGYVCINGVVRRRGQA